MTNPKRLQPDFGSPREALADAWASVDGKLDNFRRGKKAKSVTAYGGHYEGYMSDADELLTRLKRRGYELTKKKP